MANTFKVKTKLNTGISSGVSTIYTVPSSTTAVLVGLTLANTSASAITATVTLTNNDGASDEARSAMLEFIGVVSTSINITIPTINSILLSI